MTRMKLPRRLKYVDLDRVMAWAIGAASLIVLIACVIILINTMLTAMPSDCVWNRASMDCIAARVARCMADERFTRQECIELVGRQR